MLVAGSIIIALLVGLLWVREEVSFRADHARAAFAAGDVRTANRFLSGWSIAWFSWLDGEVAELRHRIQEAESSSKP